MGMWFAMGTVITSRPQLLWFQPFFGSIKTKTNLMNKVKTNIYDINYLKKQSWEIII